MSLPDAYPSASRPATRVVAIIAKKDGVGTLRATTTVNLAVVFVEADDECLLIDMDMDAQSGGATGALGVELLHAGDPLTKNHLVKFSNSAAPADAVRAAHS